LPLLAFLTLLVSGLLTALVGLLPLLITTLLIASIRLRPFARPLLQRLETARQTLCATEGLFALGIGVLLLSTLSERSLGFFEPLPQLVDAACDVVLGGSQRLLAVAAVHERLGIADLVAKTVVANRTRGFRQFP
jgi:hypothetical protein